MASSCTHDAARWVGKKAARGVEAFGDTRWSGIGAVWWGEGETFRKRGEAGTEESRRRTERGQGNAESELIIDTNFEAVAAVHSGCRSGMDGVVICFGGRRLISAALVTLILASFGSGRPPPLSGGTVHACAFVFDSRSAPRYQESRQGCPRYANKLGIPKYQVLRERGR
jgi:hypothetical protein